MSTLLHHLLLRYKKKKDFTFKQALEQGRNAHSVHGQQPSSLPYLAYH
jgi:hypothetical protein